MAVSIHIELISKTIVPNINHVFYSFRARQITPFSFLSYSDKLITKILNHILLNILKTTTLIIRILFATVYKANLRVYFHVLCNVLRQL